MIKFDELLIAETTEYEFKSKLEISRPKSWLKTVSAFSNSFGGRLYFGVENNGIPVGLPDAQETAEQISRFIKERISPIPEFNLTVHSVETGNNVIMVKIPRGNIPPYYYVGDGNTTAYVRIGNESVPASPQQLSELVRRGRNLFFDSMPTDYKIADLTFTIFEATYKKVTEKMMSEKEYISFGMCQHDGTLTYAGLLFADDSPLLQNRVFCTRWDGLTKGSLGDDAIDSEEFQGDIISLLKNSHNFVRLNSKVRWKKMPDHRINKPDYADRAVFEALANALMHRDYSVVGSEVHVDMYDDRMAIYSPGGMYDGSLIQELNIEEVPSIRRNPTVADIFNRLEFSERQGSGLRKIRRETKRLHGYTDDLAPEFISTHSTFYVVFKNMNYDLHGATMQATMQDTMQDERIERLLDFCNEARNRDEIQQFIGLANRDYFRKAILKPLIESGKIKMTIPDKPNSRNQKYIRT